jgi:hypothetical protein
VTGGRLNVASVQPEILPASDQGLSQSGWTEGSTKEQ